LAEAATLKDSIPPITAELAGLIEGQSMVHAEIVQRLEATVIAADVGEIRAGFCSMDMWGGSGSVADLSLDDPIAQKRACELLSRLNAQFRDAGIKCARADQWTDTFDQWLDQGVFDNDQ
jgi:hypothetical protein